MPQRVRQCQSVVYVRPDVGIDPDSHGDRTLNGFVHISETSLPIGQIVYESGLMGGASVSRVLEPDDVVVKLSLAELLMEPVEFCPTGRS